MPASVAGMHFFWDEEDVDGVSILLIAFELNFSADTTGIRRSLYSILLQYYRADLAAT